MSDIRGTRSGLKENCSYKQATFHFISARFVYYVNNLDYAKFIHFTTEATALDGDVLIVFVFDFYSVNIISQVSLSI